MSQPHVERRLTAILAADVAGYSRLMGQDETATLAVLKGHRDVVRATVERRGGRVVDTAGDSVLADFASAVGAISAAVEIQEALGARNDGLLEAQRMLLRIGVNLGDVLIDGGTIYGDGVNIAARLQAMAEPGGICISAAAFDQVRDKVPYTFADTGEHTLKNIARPIRVYTFTSTRQAADKPLEASPPNALRLPDKPSIAVLPFTNMSGDGDQEYLADGIVEDTITTLSQVSSLFVVARNSSFAFKGKTTDIRDVGRQLGVRYVLEGSVRRSGDRLRVTAQLIDATDGAHVWAERYDRQVRDVFDIQDELTKEIVTALRIKLTDGEQASIWLRSTNDFQAWSCATRGADHIWRGTASAMSQARALLEQAVSCDPRYAKATALIAMTHYFDVRFNYTPSQEESKRKLAEFTSKALQLDPDEPYAMVMQAGLTSLEGRFNEAIENAKLAVARSPNDTFCWLMLARVLVNAEQSAEAESAIRHAMRLNPFYPINYLAVLGDALVHQGRSSQALEVFNEIVKRQPNYISAHLHLAGLQGSLGNMAAARAAVAEVLRIDPKYRIGAAASFYLSADENRKRAFLDLLRSAGLPD